MEAPAARRSIERQFPELAPVRVAYLGAGQDSTAFDVNDRWVFRFPARAEVESQLLVERAILPRLAPRLRVAIPNFRYFGEPDADAPFHFCGYEKLPGQPAVQRETRVTFDAIAPQIARVLSAVHAFPLDEARACGVITSDASELFEEVRLSAVAGLEIVRRESVELTRGVERYLEQLAPIPPAPWPMTLVHNDLAAEHTLLDDAGTTITGVIDWGDVAIADPTVDFVGLHAWGGEPFVRAVLAHYHGPVDERVLARVGPWAAFKGIEDIKFGIDNDNPDWVRMGLQALTREVAEHTRR